MHCKVWHEITYPFPNFNGAKINNCCIWSYSALSYNGCNYLSMVGFKLTLASKRGPYSGCYGRIRLEFNLQKIPLYLVLVLSINFKVQFGWNAKGYTKRRTPCFTGMMILYSSFFPRFCLRYHQTLLTKRLNYILTNGVVWINMCKKCAKLSSV